MFHVIIDQAIIKSVCTCISVPVCVDSTCHSGSVTCMDGHVDDVMIATGSEDSTVKLLNTSSGKVSSAGLKHFTPKSE